MMKKEVTRLNPDKDEFEKVTVDVNPVIPLDRRKKKIVAQWIQQGYIDTADLQSEFDNAGFDSGLDYPAMRKFFLYLEKEY